LQTCRLAVKRQKKAAIYKHRYPGTVGKMQSRGRQRKADAKWLARGRERQVEISRSR
jgi:hypothetical protein